jgi:hypothetical protein
VSVLSSSTLTGKSSTRQIATVEPAILGLVEADVGLSDRFAILTSIPGVSHITAFALLIEMPELGPLEAGQAASLVARADRASVWTLGRTRLRSWRPRQPVPGSLCQRSSPLVSILIGKQNISSSLTLENPPRSP